MLGMDEEDYKDPELQEKISTLLNNFDPNAVIQQEQLNFDFRMMAS